MSDADNKDNNQDKKQPYAPQPFRTAAQSRWGMFGDGAGGPPVDIEKLKKKSESKKKQPHFNPRVLRSGIYLNNSQSVIQVQRAYESMTGTFRWPFSRQIKESAALIVYNSISRPTPEHLRKLIKAGHHSKLGPLLKKWGVIEAIDGTTVLNELGLHAFASAVVCKREEHGAIKISIRSPFVQAKDRDSARLRKLTQLMKLYSEMTDSDIMAARQVRAG